VCAILIAVAVDFFFNCWYLEIPSDNHIQHIPKCVHYHAQGLRLEMFQNFYVGSGSRKVQIDLSIVLYMRRLLFVESFDLHRSNQYIFVRVIPSCFRFMKICLCQISLLSRCSLTYLISSSWGELDIVYMGQGACCECDVD
jgi:hypothetical protein